MSILEFILLLLIAGLCGSIAQSLVGYSREGCLVSIALGFIGALLGSWIARETNLSEPFTIQVGSRPFPMVWSIIGASLFAALISLLQGRRHR